MADLPSPGNAFGKRSRSRPAIRRLVALLGVVCSGALPLDAAPAPETWVLCPEPSFMRPQVAAAVPGSLRTLFAAGTWDGAELRLLKRGEISTDKAEWEQFVTRARANADRLLETAKPQIERDARGVIRSIVLRGENPPVALCLAAPGLAAKFEPQLGPVFYAAAPNRHILVLFPKVGVDREEFGMKVLMANRNSAWPVSRELFEVSQRGVQASGEFGR